jgi:ATP adenylyltransferase
MTESYIHVVPRTTESYVLENGESVSINSLGFAGTILTKSQEALDGIKAVGVMKVLEALGYPPVVEGEIPEAEVI